MLSCFWSSNMKLTLLMLSLLAVGTLTGMMAGPRNAHAQQPAKSDKDKLKGDWILVSNDSRGIIAEIFGQVPEPDKIRIATFSDNQLKLKVERESFLIGAYQVDSTKTPRTLDLTIRGRGGRKATLSGIYELDGDQLKLCFDSFGEARPTKFPVKAKEPEKPFGNLSVLVLRRSGADRQQDVLERNKAACADNLAILGEIMHDYVRDKRIYPTAAIYSKDGKPLLSWRVALLKRMDQGDLLNEFKTDEPWDSAHNRRLIKRMPKLYALQGVELRAMIQWRRMEDKENQKEKRP